MQDGQVHVDGREGLADFIVEFAADALAFLLLHVEDLHGLLLLANDPLALFDETDAHRVGNAVGGRFVGIEHALQQFEVVAIFLEQRAGQHVAQEQHDLQHFARFHPARDDALRQVLRVSLKGLDAAGFEHPQVTVVDGPCFRKDLSSAHGAEQLGIANAFGPFLTQLGTIAPKVRYQLTQQLPAAGRRRAGFVVIGLFPGSPHRSPGGRFAHQFLWRRG